VQSDVKVAATRQVQFKGIDHAVNLYDVVGLSGAYNVHVPEKKAETLTRLDPPLPIDCYALEGKIISDAAISGQIIRLGETVAEASIGQPVKPHSNLRILVAPQEKKDLPEVYAKVLPSEALGQTASEKLVCLQFTWLPEEVKIFLSKRRSRK
jgi:hypothetical protein